MGELFLTLFHKHFQRHISITSHLIEITYKSANKIMPNMANAIENHHVNLL